MILVLTMLWSIKGAAANRRPAGPSDGSDNLSAIVTADRAFPAAGAEVGRPFRTMKAIIAILWVQFALGVVGSFLAFGHIHMSAMGRAWSYGMRSDYEQACQSPGYHESSAIRGYTTARFIDAMETDARRRGEIAFGALAGSFVASAFAASLLFLLRRARIQYAHTTSS